MEEYAKKMTPLMREVFEAWKAGYRDPAEIAEKINANVASVRGALWKLRKAGLITEITAFQMLERCVRESHLIARMVLAGNGDASKALERIMVLMEVAQRQLNAIRRYLLIVNPKIVKRTGR